MMSPSMWNRGSRGIKCGYLVTEVMDIVDNGIKTLILDASAARHMPDVLEMPYRPPLKDSGEADKSSTPTVSHQ